MCEDEEAMSFYAHFLQHSLLPGYELLRGYKHSEHRRFLEKSQWWSPDRILDFQWRELQKLLRHAFDSVPYYQQKYHAAGVAFGDIRNWDDFARLPALTREEITRNRDALCSKAWSGKLISHSTGGSSGVPLRFYITRPSFDWRCAASERAYSWTGFGLGERTLYLWGAAVGPQSRASQIKLKVFRGLRRELMFNTFSQNEQLWNEIYRNVQRWRPKLVVGYVSSLMEFCRWLLATGKARSLGSVRAAIAAAEPVFDTSRKLVEEALGVQLFNTYGSREFMSIAAECPQHDGLHVNAENILVETDGEGIAPILITDLHNVGMPFIRYRIGDCAVIGRGTCACGRGLPRIRSIEGRELDLLRTADGRTVPGEFFPHLLKELPEVREFQVRQEAPDRIRISLVLHADLSAPSQALLEKEVEKVFGSGTRLGVERVSSIPLLPSGKRRVTIGLER